MQQWREIKSRHADAILLFRVGDFYEMFFDDAVEGARRLDLTLTSRNNGSSRAPLAGVPAHALDSYLERLVRQGCRVAICDQVEDPSEANGIVRREVTELVTPGAVFTDRLLEARRNNFLVAISAAFGNGDRLGVASADLSTGELEVHGVSPGELEDLLGRLAPAEILQPRGDGISPLPEEIGGLRTERDPWLFGKENAVEELRRRFGVLNVAGFGFEAGDDALLGACGALLSYVAEVQPVHGAHLRPPRIRRPDAAMALDGMTRRNLELVEPLRGDDAGGTLLAVLDEARTPMGGRLLRRWLVAPLLDLETICRRQEAVSALVEEDSLRDALHRALAGVRDLERLAVRVAAERAGPRELLGVGDSLAVIPLLREILHAVPSGMLGEIREGLDPLEDVRDLVAAAIDPDAPPAVGEGGVIRVGFDDVLDELRASRDGGREWVARLQQQERERTGIGSLKVGFNKVFGYYIEVTRANLKRVPEEYERRQTLANAERYVLPELKEWEAKILGAEDRIGAREAEVFRGIRSRVAVSVERIQAVAGSIASLDVLAALAEGAVRNDYVRPEVHEGFDLEIIAGRHPVVERMMPREEFIPNDVRLSRDGRVMILTGPNMAGKSTILRQVGLVQILAQIGAFVPARKARLPIADRIFTRVGASDNLARGQSTFMVEMNETAAILHGATDRSLVLLDEIGRGTSTWDGVSVAIATTEDLHGRIGAKTIFATHYHELTRLEEELDGVVNYSVAVREDGDRIVFLRRLERGGASRSYGVEVARLAGLPAPVVERAREVLGTLERTGLQAPPPAASQLALFDPGPHPVVTRLQSLEVERLTPIDALNLLAALREQAQET